MAGQSQSPFSFGAPATSGASGGLFGQQTSSSQSQGGLFGSSNQPANTSGPSLFGATTTAGGSSLFGGRGTAGGQSSNPLGSGGGGASGGGNSLVGGGDKPTPTFGFGQQPAAPSSGGQQSLFGQTHASTGQQPGASNSIFATPSKPAESATTASGQSSSLFGGGGSSIFQNAASSAPGSSATPASKPAGGFSFAPLGSTTPAGPPPASQAGESNTLNPNNQQQEQKNIFGSFGAGANSSQPSAPTGMTSSQEATASLFANLPKPPASSGGSGLFVNLGGRTSGGPSGQQTASTSLFGNQAQSSAAEAQKPTFTLPPTSSSQPSNQTPSAAQNNAPSLFSPGGQAKPPESSAPASSAPSTSLFGNLGKPGDTRSSSASSTNMFANFGKSGDAKTSTAPPSNLFTNVGKSADTGTPAAPASGAATSSLFSNLGKKQENPPTTNDAAPTSSHTQTQTTASTSNLFGKFSEPANSSAPSQTAATVATGTSAAPANANTGASTNLGASTSGPAPSAQLRLKNKSMDEIITRWASDLAKYQKEFQKQAEKVASWDHMLVENSEKIQKLYGSTLEAERATVEVERQITAVENDQNELEAWLDRYEKDVDQMIANQGDPFHGPDLERERT